VTCSKCLAVYNIPENKLKKDVSRTTCRKCGNRIEIRKPVGIPSIKPVFDSNEELSAPQPLHDVLSQAKPKRILDDERTILDEDRSEQPRPEVMTNLAFGPDPSAKGFLDDDSSVFQSFSANTMPSLRSFSSEESDPPTEERPKPVAVVVEDSEDQEEESFRLDWVVAFCSDILGFAGDQRFFWACMVAVFGVSMSLMIGMSSRFGVREGNILVSVLTSVIAVLLFNVVYIMMSST